MEGDKGAENEKELTSTNTTDSSNSSDMEVLLSSTKEKSESSTNDTLPTSSTDASTSVKSLHLVSDDPISSTSSEMDSAKSNVNISTLSVVEKTCSNFDTEAELLEMSIGVQASGKIEENVDDLVNDLETLLGESTDSFTTSVKSAEVVEENIEENDKNEVDLQEKLHGETEEMMNIVGGVIDLQESEPLKESSGPTSVNVNNDSVEETINLCEESEEQQKSVEESKPVPEINIRRKTVEQDLEKVVCLSEESSDSDTNEAVSNSHKQPENEPSYNEETDLIKIAEAADQLVEPEVPEEDIPAIDEFLTMEPEVVSSVVSADSGSNLETILAVASLENEAVSDIRVERKLTEKEIQEMEAIRMAVASITDSSQDTYDSFLVDNSVAIESCVQEVSENTQEFPVVVEEVTTDPESVTKQLDNTTLLVSSSADSQESPPPPLTGEGDLSKEAIDNINDREISQKSTFAVDKKTEDVSNSQCSDEVDGRKAPDVNEFQQITEIIGDNDAKIPEKECVILEIAAMSKEVSVDQEIVNDITEDKGEDIKTDTQKFDSSATENIYVSDTDAIVSKEMLEDVEKGIASENTLSTCNDPSSSKQSADESLAPKDDVVPESKCATLEEDGSIHVSKRQKMEGVEQSSNIKCTDIIQSTESQKDSKTEYSSISEKSKASSELELNLCQTTTEVKSDNADTSGVSSIPAVSDDAAEGGTSQKVASQVSKENIAEIANPEESVDVNMPVNEDIVETEIAPTETGEKVVEEKEKVACSESSTSVTVTEEAIKETEITAISEEDILPCKEVDKESMLSIPETDTVDTEMSKTTVGMPVSNLPTTEEKEINNKTIESIDIHERSMNVKSTSGEDAVEDNVADVVEETKEGNASVAEADIELPNKVIPGAVAPVTNETGVGMSTTEDIEVPNEGILEEVAKEEVSGIEECDRSKSTASEESHPVSEMAVEGDEIVLDADDTTSPGQPIESDTSLVQQAAKNDELSVEGNVKPTSTEDCSAPSKKSDEIVDNISDHRDENMEDNANVTSETESCVVMESVMKNDVEHTTGTEQEDTSIQNVDQLEGISGAINVSSKDEETIQTVDKEGPANKNVSVSQDIANCGSISVSTIEKELVLEPVHVENDEISSLVNEVAEENEIASQEKGCKEDDLQKSEIIVGENKICTAKSSTEEVVLTQPVGEPDRSTSEEVTKKDEEVSVPEVTVKDMNSDLHIEENGELKSEVIDSLSDHIEIMNKSNVDKHMEIPSVSTAEVDANVKGCVDKTDTGSSELMDCTETQTNNGLGADGELAPESKPLSTLQENVSEKMKGDNKCQISEQKDVDTTLSTEETTPSSEEGVLNKNISQANDEMNINTQSADQKLEFDVAATEIIKDSQGLSQSDKEKNISGRKDLDTGNEEVAANLATDEIVEEKDETVPLKIAEVSNISEGAVKGDKLSIPKSLGGSSKNEEEKKVLLSSSDNGLISKYVEPADSGIEQKTAEKGEGPAPKESVTQGSKKEMPLLEEHTEIVSKEISSDVEQLVKKNDVEVSSGELITEERQEENNLSARTCTDDVEIAEDNKLPAPEKHVAEEKQEKSKLSVMKSIDNAAAGANVQLPVSEEHVAEEGQEKGNSSLMKSIDDVGAEENIQLPPSEEHIGAESQQENNLPVAKGIADSEAGENIKFSASEEHIAEERQGKINLSGTKIVDVEAGQNTELPAPEEHITKERQEESNLSVTKGIADVEAGKDIGLPAAEERQKENSLPVTKDIAVEAEENIELSVSGEHVAEERSLRSRTRRGNKISEPLSINVEELEKKDKVYSPKITIKPVKVPDEEVSTTSDVEGNKGGLKMTITKQSDKMRSILKVFNPEDDVESTQIPDEPIPKLIIKPKMQHIEQQHSPKMTTRSSKTYSPTNTRCSSPRVSIKPVTKPPEVNPETLSPLKITLKPVVKQEEVNKKSPKALKEQDQKNVNPKITIKPIPKPSEVDKEETAVTTPKVIIRPLKRHLEGNDAENEPERSSPKITIKPVIKLDEQESEQSNISTPKLKIKPIKKQDEPEPVLEKDEGSPKISIKPVVKPVEHLEEDDEEVKERIVLKINKGNLPTPTKDPKKREYPEDDKSEKVGIKLKFSTTGGHTHIVQDGEESNKRQRKDSGYSSGAAKKDIEETSHKRPSDDKLPDKNKRLRSALTPDKIVEDNNSDHITVKEKVISPAAVSENLRFQHSSDTATPEESHRQSPDISKIADLALQTTHIEATSILTVGIATPSVSPAPKKRGRPRKSTLEVREELKDVPTSSHATSLNRSQGTPVAEAASTPGSQSGTPKVVVPSPSEGRPKRSCRGQNVIATLGIKPRKPRGGGRGRGGKVNMGDRESTVTQSPTESVQSAAVKPEKEENVSKTNLKLMQKTGREEIHKQKEEATKQREEDGSKKSFEEVKNLETDLKKELGEVEDSKRKKDDDDEQSPSKKKKEDKTPPRKLEVTTRRQRAQQQKGSEEAEKVPGENPNVDPKKPVVSQIEGGPCTEATPSSSAINTEHEIVVISDDSSGKDESIIKDSVEVAKKSPFKSSVEHLGENIVEEKEAKLEVDIKKSEVKQINIDENKEDTNPKSETNKIEERKVEENRKVEKKVEVASPEDDSDEDSEAERRREWILLKKQEAIKKCRAKRMEKLARAAELKKKRQEQAAQQREARKAAEEAERAAAEKLRATKRYGRYGLPKPQISLIDEPVQETDGTIKSHMGLFNPEIERINITQPMLIDYDSEKAGHLKHSGLIDSSYESPLKLGRSIGAEDVVMLDEETRMSADFKGSRAQTPAKHARLPPDAMVEDSQGSMGTEGGKSRSSKAPKMEVFQDSESTVFTADQLAEYSWNGQGPYMLQEQVAQYLGIKSFKRKYPHITRRPVDMQERDYLKEYGLATEAQCDLGLTAVIAQDILDIMYTDFQDKYEEYCRAQREKQARELANKQKFLNQYTLKPGFDKLDILEQVVQSAAAWNQHLNKARREQRRAYMDLQNLTVQYPKSRVKVIPTPKIGHYPVALVPGQFTDYFKEYTPTELNNLPLNTMCYDEIKIPGMETESEDSSSESDSDSESCSGSSDSNSSCQDEDCRDCVKKTKAESNVVHETDSDDVVIIENDASSSDSVVLVSVTAAPAPVTA